jgi:hypothetical protein
VYVLQLAMLGGVALLAWFDVDASGHPAVLPTAAAIIGGSSIWKAALDAVVARRITVAVTITVAVAGAGAELAFILNASRLALD